jgi:hypothetical protein
MHQKFMATVVVVALTFSLCTALAQGTPTVLDGVYTAEQAVRGQGAYQTYCMGCHEGTEQDGPDLKGAGFVDRWREDKLNVLFTQIKTNMPGNRPGSLEESTYIDILAFLLSANGLPTGNKELTGDVMKSVQLVGNDGPKPLPSLTAVRVVGCLTLGVSDAWILTNASEPGRSRTINETTSEEVHDSAAWPLGVQTFRLQNVPNRAVATKGQKVQAKGVLIRQYMNDRINVTSLQTVASTCQ